MNIRIVFLLILFYSESLISQTTNKYSGEYVTFYKAEDLFMKEQYAAARKEFRNFINETQDKNDLFRIKALYYEGISALELYNNDAVKLLEDFNQNYPESIFKTKIYYRLGKYYYQKKEYNAAIAWFEKLRQHEVESEEKEEYYFKLGYANYHLEKFSDSKKSFYEIKNGNSQFAIAALYYYSHILYKEESYQIALEGFHTLMNEETYKDLVPYYITQIYYRQGRFDDVTKFAPPFIESNKGLHISSMNQLVGDAFYRIGKFDEAIPFLENYGKRSNTSKEDDYQLAYAYYKIGSYDKAIKQFDRVCRVRDSLSQVAFYHVGECYLQKGNNASARSAFETASVLNFNIKIQEDALYNYAILSYKLDVNPYDEAVEALELYLKKFPNSDRKNEVYQYLVNVYTSSNNYDSALKSLERLPNKDIRLKGAYQIIAYNYGVELFQKANFTKAIEIFTLVDKFPIVAKTSSLSKFWIADSYYQLKKYDKAIQFYKEFLASPGIYLSEIHNDAYYNIAYSYFNQKDYTQAIEAFRVYLQQGNLKSYIKKADATLRLADIYYATKQNDLAIQYYKETFELRAGNQDQALIYLSRVHGFKLETDFQIKYLLEIINNQPKSKYMLTAIHELGLSYRFKGEDEKAMPFFNQIVQDYPSSILVKDALIEIADIYFKKKEYAKSEENFKKVLDAFESDRNTCARAVKGLVEIYKADKKLEKIDEISGKYTCSDFTQDEQEYVFYNAAIEPYIDSAFKEAIPAFENYLKRYPQGKYEIEIKAYLANSLFRSGNEQSSIDIYKDLLNLGNNAFTEIAALRVSRYQYNNANYEEAISPYERLEIISSKPEIVYNSRIGLMRSYYILENWVKTKNYAEKVLTNTQINNNIRLEAEFAKGMSAYHLNLFLESKPALEWVIKNANNAFASESKFTMALMYFQQKEIDQAEIEIRELLKMKPAYDFWIAKALMLQSKILIEKDDLFQAEQTLNSVISNYPVEDDGIVLEAKALWNELMQLKIDPEKTEIKKSTIIEINKGN
jgi:tetratricopeptide (TPR) repeat protein